VSWKVLTFDGTNSTAIRALYRIRCTLWPVLLSDNSVSIVKITIGTYEGTITTKVCLMIR